MASADVFQEYKTFSSILDQVRARNPLQVPHQYYPYGTLHIIPQLLPALKKYGLDLMEFVSQRALLDLGCGDGELAFFLERFGPKRVVAIDAPAFNYNAMEACYVLKKVLGSQVEFLDVDVHRADFDRLPHFDSTFCFGFLYHSQHPLWVLENLARLTDHLFLTTKVFDHSEAYAYFYDVAECNNDPTNWWCFTPKALALMLKRAGFTVAFSERLDQHLGKSHPVDLRRDGRLFVYARRSNMSGDRLISFPPVVNLEETFTRSNPARYRFSACAWDHYRNSRIRAVLCRTHAYLRALLPR